jgi:pimeloyl-ACP methyl ester carboxylesterase
MTGRSSEPPHGPPHQPQAELVVLVHGMGRTPLSMRPLSRAIERGGFRVLNFGYSSYGPSIKQIGRKLARRLETVLQAQPAARVHFVGHSLGNIIVRWLIAHARPPALGRVVMLAPPNRGARVADRFSPYLRWLLAPLPELVTQGGLCEALAPPRGVEVGILAGRFDRKVRVEETHLEGASAHAVVPAGHTFIMLRADVQSLVLRFLREGRFC